MRSVSQGIWDAKRVLKVRVGSLKVLGKVPEGGGGPVLGENYTNVIFMGSVGLPLLFVVFPPQIFQRSDLFFFRTDINVLVFIERFIH